MNTCWILQDFSAFGRVIFLLEHDGLRWLIFFNKLIRIYPTWLCSIISWTLLNSICEYSVVDFVPWVYEKCWSSNFSVFLFFFLGLSLFAFVVPAKDWVKLVFVLNKSAEKHLKTFVKFKNWQNSTDEPCRHGYFDLDAFKLQIKFL